MAQPKDGERGESSGGSDRPNRRRRGKRRRTVLNLGMPFLQVDDFVNQSEDAVALGYKVLVETVEEIKKGYEEAKAFYNEQKAYDEGKRKTPPPVPWEQMVERAETLQDIGLNAMRDGTGIFLDSIRSGMKSTRSLAKTWEQSREDVGTNPVLAGPVFEDPVEITAKAGQMAEPVERPIRHRGLARLRIHAVVDPSPKEIQRPRKVEYNTTEAPPAEIFRGHIKVGFEPPTDTEKYDPDTSLLTVDVGWIPETQKPGEYVGLIRASNFELLIARLRITVLDRLAEDRPLRPTV